MSEIKKDMKMEEDTKDTKDTKYRDPSPEETKKIVGQIKNAEMHDDVVNIMNTTFPTWFLGWPKKYCVDYPHMQSNWKFTCKKSKCNTLSVVIVDKIVFNDPDYSLIKLFAELLTVFGHSVRRKEEFIGCVRCGDAIPTQMVYNQLKERSLSVPSHWMTQCIKC
jgi:hypothetical protein